MKKIFLLASMLAIVAVSMGQSSFKSTTNLLARDTVTNGAVKVWGAIIPAYQETIGIQVTVTQISGTLGGTIIPVASLDGVNWYPAGASTFTVTNVASQGVLFSAPLGYLYYGVQWTGTGTMSGSLVAKYLQRRKT